MCRNPKTALAVLSASSSLEIIISCRPLCKTWPFRSSPTWNSLFLLDLFAWGFLLSNWTLKAVRDRGKTRSPLRGLPALLYSFISLCQLYGWRYRALGNLPHVYRWPEFMTANAGFFFDYQLINVEDFKGVGESQPNPHFYQVNNL